MSNEDPAGSGARRNRPTYTPALTPDDFERWAKIIKQLVSDSGLKWWIIAAGVGAVVETLHIVWLAARYLLKF
jgi:hypothetical protein